MTKNKFLINSYLLLLKSVDDESEKERLIKKINCLLDDYGKEESLRNYETELNDLSLQEKEMILVFLSHSNKTSALDIWINCLKKNKKYYSQKEARRINRFLTSLSEWEPRTKLDIRKSCFNYRGRGFRRISD